MQLMTFRNQYIKFLLISLLHLNLFCGSAFEWEIFFTLTQIKLKEVVSKIAHRIGYIMWKKHLLSFETIEYNCWFCNSESETIVNLFFECPCSSLFWPEMSQFLIFKMKFKVALKSVKSFTSLYISNRKGLFCFFCLFVFCY